MADRYTQESAMGLWGCCKFLLAVALFAVYLVVVAVTSLWLTAKDTVAFIKDGQR
jgi:hypothetical protein